jgi:hypothetical protein
MPRWHHPVFMTKQHKPARKRIPVSCIQSAEFIIQTVHNSGLVWKEGQDLEPHVYMHFGSGQSYNITTTENLQDVVTGANDDFDLASRPPRNGEGIAFINVSKENAKFYNMHFMAVLATSETDGEPSFMMSNLSEQRHRRKLRQEFLSALVKEDRENIKHLSGTDIWKKERDQYQKENGGDFRMALLSTSPTRPM